MGSDIRQRRIARDDRESTGKEKIREESELVWNIDALKVRYID